MSTWRTWLLALCLAATAQAQETVDVPALVRVEPSQFFLEVRNSLVFPDAVLNGQSQLLHGLEAPVYQIVDARGDPRSGWRLTFTLSSFSSTDGQQLPATALRFTSSGGRVVLVAGVPVDPVNGPAETQTTSTLQAGFTALSSRPGYGMGTYLYEPLAGSFQVEIPASAAAGEYQATLVANLLVGP